jgi:hypothetical protein
MLVMDGPAIGYWLSMSLAAAEWPTMVRVMADLGRGKAAAARYAARESVEESRALRAQARQSVLHARYLQAGRPELRSTGRPPSG